MRIPSDVSTEVRQTFLEIQEEIEKLTKRNIDLNGRRIINAGKSTDTRDYVTKGELTSEAVAQQIIRYVGVPGSGNGSGIRASSVSSTDHAIVRWDGTTARNIQDYLAAAPTISDLGLSNFRATMQVTGSGTPGDDAGVELQFSANIGFAFAYDRDNTVYREMRVCGDPVNILQSTTNVERGFKVDAGEAALGEESDTYMNILADTDNNSADTDALLRFYVDRSMTGSPAGTLKGTVGYDQGNDVVFMGYGGTNSITLDANTEGGGSGGELALKPNTARYAILEDSGSWIFFRNPADDQAMAMIGGTMDETVWEPYGSGLSVSGEDFVSANAGGHLHFAFGGRGVAAGASNSHAIFFQLTNDATDWAQDFLYIEGVNGDKNAGIVRPGYEHDLTGDGAKTTVDLGTSDFPFNDLYLDGILYVNTIDDESAGAITFNEDLLPNAATGVDIGNATYPVDEFHVLNIYGQREPTNWNNAICFYAGSQRYGYMGEIDHASFTAAHALSLGFDSADIKGAILLYRAGNETTYKAPYIWMESADGTAYYIYVTNAGAVAVSATEPS